MEFLCQSCSTASSTQDELDPEKYTSSGTPNSFGRSSQIHLVQADRGGHVHRKNPAYRPIETGVPIERIRWQRPSLLQTRRVRKPSVTTD